MSKNIAFTDKEVEDLYDFLEAANALFHQPLNYQNTEVVEQFADKYYPKIRELYYTTLWEKLPEAKKKAILDE